MRPRYGWHLDEAHIYADDGISGAEFAKRPGLVALLAALKPTPPFAVLLLFDADRLGREQFETSYLLKQLDLAGVAIHETKPGGQQITFDTPMDKLMTSLLTGAAEIEKAKVSVRTRSALQAKFERGHVVGGTVFGYTNVAVLTPDGKRSHVTREIHPEEAVVVREIFARYAQRRGGPHHRQAASTRRARCARSPRRQVQRGWAPSSVRVVLHNDLYRGRGGLGPRAEPGRALGPQAPHRAPGGRVASRA